MNLEKNSTQATSSVGEYLAPNVKVIEIKARQVVCASSNDLGSWNYGEDEL